MNCLNFKNGNRRGICLPHGTSSKRKLGTKGRQGTILLGMLAAILVSGCASNKIQTESAGAENLPRPDQILVYDFAATPAEVPADSTIAREFSIDPSKQTPEQSSTGRALGAQIASHLATHLQKAGLPAKHVALGDNVSTDINDIVIRGYLVSFKEGSAAKRIIIGFGAGASELQAAAEVFQVTEQGLNKLGSGTGKFRTSKGPGASAGAGTFAATANPAGLIVSGGTRLYGEVRGSSKIYARAQTAAKEIATILEKRARELGWID